MSDTNTPANTLAYFTVPLPSELIDELRAVAADCGRTPEEWASLVLGGRLAQIRFRKRMSMRLDPILGSDSHFDIIDRPDANKAGGN